MSQEQKQKNRSTRSPFGANVMWFLAVIAGALVGLLAMKGLMDTAAHDASVPHGSASAQVAPVIPTAQPEVPPSLCVEGNRCSPDSTGPWDGICPSSKDPSVILQCKGGRLVKRDAK